MSDSDNKTEKLSFLDKSASVHVECQVRLPDFEGPLDLLLYLIKTHEMDLLNLSVSNITKQYLNYLKYMKTINIDVASDYLVMAATLTYLKSQLILPKEELDESMGPDPKAQLVKRLIELKNYKDLSDKLSKQPRLYREIFIKSNQDELDDIDDSLEPQVELTNPFQMLEAYTDLLERRKTVTHNVAHDSVPIISCVHEIADQLKTKDHVYLNEMLPQPYKAQHLISMFLAGLELSKMQMTRLEQEINYDPIKFIRNKSSEEFIKFSDSKKMDLSWD